MQPRPRRERQIRARGQAEEHKGIFQLARSRRGKADYVGLYALCWAKDGYLLELVDGVYNIPRIKFARCPDPIVVVGNFELSGNYTVQRGRDLVERLDEVFEQTEVQDFASQIDPEAEYALLTLVYPRTPNSAPGIVFEEHFDAKKYTPLRYSSKRPTKADSRARWARTMRPRS